MSDDETMNEPIEQPTAVYVVAGLAIALFLMFGCAMSSMYRAF